MILLWILRKAQQYRAISCNIRCSFTDKFEKKYKTLPKNYWIKGGVFMLIYGVQSYPPRMILKRPVIFVGELLVVLQMAEISLLMERRNTCYVCCFLGAG